MASPLILSDATRIINVIDSRIAKAVGSGAGLEVTYGQVAQLTGNNSLSAYLYGDTANASAGFRGRAGLHVEVGDRVRVTIDARGARWVEEVFIPTPYPKVELDPVRGHLLLGSGSVAPANGTTGNVLTVADAAGTLVWQSPAVGLALGSTVTSETAFGQAASAGAAATASKSDHTHGTPPAPTVYTPASSVVSVSGYGASSVIGSSALYARQDHSHGSVPLPSSSLADFTVNGNIIIGSPTTGSTVAQGTTPVKVLTGFGDGTGWQWAWGPLTGANAGNALAWVTDKGQLHAGGSTNSIIYSPASASCSCTSTSWNTLGSGTFNAAWAGQKFLVMAVVAGSANFAPGRLLAAMQFDGSWNSIQQSSAASGEYRTFSFVGILGAPDTLTRTVSLLVESTANSGTFTAYASASGYETYIKIYPLP